MLQDESLDYIRQQFEDKGELLEAYGERVTAWTLYEYIYGSNLEWQQAPVVILDEDMEKHIVPMFLSDAIQLAEDRSDMLLGGTDYFNNWISKRSARNVNALIIDLDNVYSGTLQQALIRDWADANGKPMAKPSFVVNSGTGLHLYYVFNRPVPAYHRCLADIDAVYRALAVQQSHRNFIRRQVQWFGQDFRIAGGLNKYGWTNAVYRIGDLWDPDELAKAVGLPNIRLPKYGVDARRKKTGRQASKHGARSKTGGWKTNAAFYRYALEGCRAKTKEGHRYTSMCALTTIGWKCGIPKGQIEADLHGLLADYNADCKNKVMEKEIYSAMKMYNDKAMLTTRNSLEEWQGWVYTPIKRNHRKRAVHLKIARNTLAILNEDNGKALQGRPNKQAVVEDWQRSHPEGRKADCIRDTGLSKPTVFKYWKG